MMTSKMRALSGLAVALTFVGAATLAGAQEAAMPSSPSGVGAVSPTQADKAVNAAINNLSDSAAKPEHPKSPAASVAKGLAGKVEDGSDLSALHDPALRAKLNDVLSKMTPERRRLNTEYQKASAIFPTFCKDWEQKLRDREVNNLDHIIWKVENGFETALYTGYSKVESCEAHQSPQGFSIGKLTYEEYKYRIQGKTVDEAKHTKATPVDDTHTTEIFRWDKGKWFY